MAKNNSISWKDYLKLANKEIFDETIKVIKRLINENKTKLDELNVKLGEVQSISNLFSVRKINQM